MNSDELPPRQPALFALAVLVQAWFLTLRPRKRALFLLSLRKLIGRYREGSRASWRPDMTPEQVQSTSWTTVNWVERLADGLEELSK